MTKPTSSRFFLRTRLNIFGEPRRIVSTFESQGVKLFYKDKGNGQPIVFVHGSLCDYRVWSAQTEALSLNFRTISYSRRYAHPNEREGDMMDSTVQNNSTDLEALIRGLELERAHLVGHSYGGFIAAYFATQHPDLLRSLTLVNAAVATMLLSNTSASAALSLLLRSPSVGLSVRRFLNATHATIEAADGGDRSAAERIFVQTLQNGRTDLPAKPRGFSEMLADNSTTLKETTTRFPQLTARQTKDIKTPTLVVWGELSALWDSKISEMLSQSIPNRKSAKIAGAGHFCMMEKPKEVNSHMREFLSRNS